MGFSSVTRNDDMPTIECPECYEDVSEQAQTCSRCGHSMLPAEASTSSSTGNSRPIGGPIAALIGAFLLTIGPFLPWITLGMHSGTGIEIIGKELYILAVLGLAGAWLPIESLAFKTPMRRWGPLVMGILGGALTLYYMVNLLNEIASVRSINPELGMGSYLSLAGAAMLIVGAIAKNIRVSATNLPPSPA